MIFVSYLCYQNYSFISEIVTKVKDYFKIRMSWWGSGVAMEVPQKIQIAEFLLKNSSLKKPIPGKFKFEEKQLRSFP